MKSDSRFLRSARTVPILLNVFLSEAVKHLRLRRIPSLMELQTVCRETGCRLPELDSFQRALDQRPAVLLCGGGAGLTEELARLLGYDPNVPDISEAPVVWAAGGNRQEGIILRHGRSEQKMSRKALDTLLSGKLNTEDITLIEEFHPVDAGWRLLWIPFPHVMENLLTTPLGFEVMLSQRAAVVCGKTSEAVVSELQSLGQKLWRLGDDGVPFDTVKSELNGLISDAEHDYTDADAARWSWFAEKLLEITKRQRQDYSLSIDRQKNHMQTTRHLLDQYRTNWQGNLYNLVEKYISDRVNSPAISGFLDIQKPPPDRESYMTAISVGGLKRKIRSYLTDRMAEFVAGLSALATKIELRRIAIGDVQTEWNVKNVFAKIDRQLDKPGVFPQESRKRGGLMKSLTGKRQAILDERKASISRAGRIISNTVKKDFEEWCGQLMTAVEKQVRMQLAGALANRGLPDVDALHVALEGLTRLTDIIQGDSDSPDSSPEVTTRFWLTDFTQRRWVPLHRSS